MLTKQRVVPAVLVVAGGVAAAILGGIVRPAGNERSGTEASGPMPAIDRAALTGGRVTPGSYEGRAVLVNFWASWCGPCRAEQPGLERLSREIRDIAFIGVNFKDDRAAARAYLDEFDVTYPSVSDPDGLLAHRFGVPYLPATVLVDATGEMRYRLVGAQTETALRSLLEDLTLEA